MGKGSGHDNIGRVSEDGILRQRLRACLDHHRRQAETLDRSTYESDSLRHRVNEHPLEIGSPDGER